MRKVWWSLALGGILLGFGALLCHYGEIIMPAWPDEVLFLQPAQNLAEGLGMGTPALDELLPGIATRTYWHPPAYFMALSLWGKLFGFELTSGRWFSRLCGAVGLLLLFALACQWGYPLSVSLFCVLWTASDLTYQYNANLARMDMFNAILLLLTLLLFTVSMERKDERAFWLPGLSATLAILTHLIAVPMVAILWATLAFQRRWQALLWFSLPIAFGLAGWLIYALQDWGSFTGQIAAQFQRKAATGFTDRWAFHQSVHKQFFAVFPSNLPFSLSIVILSTVALRSRSFPLSGWQWASLLTAFISFFVGGEMWYAGWWTPFCYLLLGSIGTTLVMGLKMGLKVKTIILALALIWCGYQMHGISQNILQVPVIRQDTLKFFSELSRFLSKGATVLVYTAPDPTFHLRRNRPDLRLYERVPRLIKSPALASLFNRSDYFVSFAAWAEEDQAEGRLPRSAQLLRRWDIRAPYGSIPLVLYAIQRRER